jgi:DNA-binding beta-propeller fold protein YncE
VFVVDSNNDRVESFASDGTYIKSVGTTGSGIGQFRSPCGMAFAPDGSVFVTDTGNHRVEKFGQPGPLSQFAIGAPSAPTSGSPQKITVTAMDAAGDVISDYSGSPSWSDAHAQLTGSPAAFSGWVGTNTVTVASLCTLSGSPYRMAR